METEAQEIQRIFQLQKSNQYNVSNTTVSQRRAKLDKLRKQVLNHRPQIKEALFQDYRKHPDEVDLVEIFHVTSELNHAIKHLKSWMKDKRVGTPLAFIGSSSYIKYEPKGVVLIISPWNFPVSLTFGPLIAAIAAGNTLMIKPSELTPHASAVMKQMIEGIFDENEVAVVEGGIPTSTELLKLPFNHIFFTGSPSVGKIVMTAAAKHLTSVTLELGGKSPTFIDESADIESAAHRIVRAKFANNGQACIAPDYAFVHETKKDIFVAEVKKKIIEFYTQDAATEPSYCRIVNTRHYKRVKSYIDDAVAKGATIEAGGQYDESQNYIAPTLITGAPKDSLLMTEEIFGPVLPILSYTDVNEVIDHIKAGEKPLALYIYSKERKNVRHILDNTRAGGTCINHSAVHFFNSNLPFGGSNNSGIGKGHGRHGFETFSNARAIFKQHVPSSVDILTPPFGGLISKLIDLVVRWL